MKRSNTKCRGHGSVYTLLLLYTLLWNHQQQHHMLVPCHTYYTYFALCQHYLINTIVLKISSTPNYNNNETLIKLKGFSLVL